MNIGANPVATKPWLPATFVQSPVLYSPLLVIGQYCIWKTPRTLMSTTDWFIQVMLMLNLLYNVDIVTLFDLCYIVQQRIHTTYIHT